MEPLVRLLEAGGAVMVPILLVSFFAWGLGIHAWVRARGEWRDLRRRAVAPGEIDVAALEARQLLLGSFVVILPLFGLLGTVSGIIDTFEVIREVGRGEPRLMARGIREALIATEAGLVTALPALALHHLIGSLLEKIRDEREAEACRLRREGVS
jgi:biopolymer transport protein ExbB